MGGLFCLLGAVLFVKLNWVAGVCCLWPKVV